MSQPPGTSDDSGPDDAALMRRIAEGDEAALRTLIDRWQGPLVNFFYRSLSDQEQAEDLAQVTFVRVYRAAETYTPTAKFSTYLFQIARRLLINEYKRAERRPLHYVDPSDLRAVAAPAADDLHWEVEEAFRRALARLPENQRTAILLLKQQELSYQEIADIMGAQEGAVKTWIFRARQFLKQELKDVV